jgi:signal transduction histidine kinase
MRKRISLRWKLILLSWSLALGTALVLTVLFHFRNRDQLLHQLERTLEWKCDEVITVFESHSSRLMLEEFFHVETNYRSSPHTYFYQIAEAGGRILARSENLGDFEFPIPRVSNGTPVRLRTAPDPSSQGDRRILLRSERLELTSPGGEPGEFVIQTAASLVPFEAAVNRTFRQALLVAASGLAVVFFLLWFATTRSLRPVSAMTQKASQIKAKNVREQLPLSGRGDELDELAGVLNDMLDRLGGSLRQIEQFSSDVAHELRTPLTRIRGELDLILRSDVSEPPRSQLEMIQEELERLSRLCRRLLLLARIDQGAHDAGLFDKWVDLEEVVSELLEQMTPLAQDSGAELRRGATAKARVRGSRSLIVEALLNLLDNAIHVTPEGGTVTLSIHADNGTVRAFRRKSGSGYSSGSTGSHEPRRRRPTTESAWGSRSSGGSLRRTAGGWRSSKVQGAAASSAWSSPPLSRRDAKTNDPPLIPSPKRGGDEQRENSFHSMTAQ